MMVMTGTLQRLPVAHQPLKDPSGASACSTGKLGGQAGELLVFW